MSMFDNDDFFKDFDQSFARSERNFWRAWYVILGLVITFWVVAIVILVAVLRHFGIL
jgi:hypothetical protein